MVGESKGLVDKGVLGDGGIPRIGRLGGLAHGRVDRRQFLPCALYPEGLLTGL